MKRKASSNKSARLIDSRTHEPRWGFSLSNKKKIVCVLWIITDYEVYSRKIRQEYGYLTEPVFLSGRANVLRGLLDTGSNNFFKSGAFIPEQITTMGGLFHTELGVQLWESNAAANIQSEILHHCFLDW